MPDAAGLEIVANGLRQNVAPDAVVETSFYRQQACIEILPDHLLATLTWLKNDPQQAYCFLASVHGCDYLPQAPRLGVHYELLNMQRVERLRVKLRVDVDNAVVDSCMALFATAEFQEREIFDMFGVHFNGHPDMRRILMPEDYEGHPQRRDFALGGEPVMFTHNEPGAPGWYK
ncbi:MAG: NADH-quinone oxidoreductase subunit C [Thermoleophilaceae bacterium]|nr:NADH-quinone oxidoreductase subunit C [Thermoleophilaceae bacterium]